MYPYPKTASMVTMVAMVGNSVGKSAKKVGCQILVDFMVVANPD